MSARTWSATLQRRDVVNAVDIDDRRWQVPDFETFEFHPRRTRYCLCVPVINEGQRIRTQLSAMQPFASLVDFIIVDGGSVDGSMDHGFLRDNKVRTLLVKKGPGKLSAQLRVAYAYALKQGYDGIITIDGNNKDGVEAIPRFVKELDAGTDLTQGSRYVPGGAAINTPWSRVLAIKLIHVPAISLAARFRYSDTTNGFRGYSRRLMLHPDIQPFRDVFIGYELLWYMSARAPRTGHKVKEIPVTRGYPDAGPTPTKVKFIPGHLTIIKNLLQLLVGYYNPVSSK